MKNIKLLFSVCIMMLFVCVSCDNSLNETVTVTITPDLTYWDLQGPVKHCNDTEFDRQGTMVSIGGYNPFTIEQAYRDLDGDEGFVEFAKWERDEEGRVATVTNSGMLYLLRQGQILSS